MASGTRAFAGLATEVNPQRWKEEVRHSIARKQHTAKKNCYTLYFMWDSLRQVLTFIHHTILCAIRTVLRRVVAIYRKLLYTVVLYAGTHAENDFGLYRERMPSTSSQISCRILSLPWRYCCMVKENACYVHFSYLWLPYIAVWHCALQTASH